MHPNVLKGSKDRARRYVADKLAVLCTADDAGIDLDIRGRKPGSGGHNKKMRAEDCSHDIALAWTTKGCWFRRRKLPGIARRVATWGHCIPTRRRQ